MVAFTTYKTVFYDGSVTVFCGKIGRLTFLFYPFSTLSSPAVSCFPLTYNFPSPSPSLLLHLFFVTLPLFITHQHRSPHHNTTIASKPLHFLTIAAPTITIITSIIHHLYSPFYYSPPIAAKTQHSITTFPSLLFLTTTTTTNHHNIYHYVYYSLSTPVVSHSSSPLSL